LLLLLTNYKAIVVLDKNAYFQGEQVTGKVVLGRYDENTVPISVTGAKLDPATGQAKIAITAGGVGEQNFEVNLLLLKTENNFEI
jgi:hypothetical protein